MNLLAERMGLTVLYHSISADGKSFGRVIFEDAECELYDADSEQIIKKKLSRNTIILDTHATSFFSLGSEKITLAHEIVHLHLHKSAFLFAKIIEKDLSQLECRNGGLISADDDPMKWFEIHANGIAPCIAMPKENFIAKYKEYEDIYVASKGSYIEAIESIIKALSDFFGVTRYSVKKRLLDLGIQTIIDFSADNQVLLKDPKFAEKVRQQNDAENEIKRKIAGLDLAGTLNILKEVFGWKNLAMSLDIEKDQKTIERYLGGKVKNPTIGVVIAMCLAMKLTPDLTCEVLKNAGFSIQSNSVRDKALRTIITSCRGKTIQEVNEILIGLGEEPLT